MFILYAVVIGIVAGLVLGGRLSGLATFEFRWPWLAIGGFAVQLLLFSDPVDEVVGSAGPPIYVASTAAVLVAVLRNVRIPGLALVALGAASNLLAIVANGGFMPASAEAYAALGQAPEGGYTNSAIVASPAFGPLTDVYALPAWMPLANVFSVGDVLIGAGVVIVLVSAMRRGGLEGKAEVAIAPGGDPGAARVEAGAAVGPSGSPVAAPAPAPPPVGDSEAEMGRAPAP